MQVVYREEVLVLSVPRESCQAHSQVKPGDIYSIHDMVDMAKHTLWKKWEIVEVPTVPQRMSEALTQNTTSSACIAQRTGSPLLAPLP